MFYYNPTCSFGVKSSKDAEIFLYSSCDGVHLVKENLPQDILSWRVDWYYFRTCSVPLKIAKKNITI